MNFRFNQPFKTNQMKKAITAICIAFSMNLSAQIGNGLVAHYEFQGNGADWSNHQPDATGNNTTYVTDRFGNANAALHFSGQQTSYAECGNDNSLRIQGDISISLWIQMESTNTEGGRILSFETEDGLSSSGYYIGTTQDTGGWHVVFGLGEWQTNLSWLQAGAVIHPGTWHHVAVVGDGSTMSIYFDGVFSDGIFYTPSLNAFTTSLQLGRKSDVMNDPYAGAVDDVRIYNRALQLSEIQYLAAYNPTGIAAPETAAFDIAGYPNPARTTYTVETPFAKDDDVLVFVYDATGKTVTANVAFVRDEKGIRVEIGVAAFLKGTYYVTIVAGNDKLTTRFVKE